MAAVELRGVAKAYGDVRVLEGLDLAVRDGELMVLVGPSGCGKSTALRLVAGLEDATAGTIRIGDRVVNDVAPRDRDVAMVFQSYALYPHMTVRENLAFGLRLRGVEPGERERRVADAARTLGLEPLLDRKPRALSGGQRQRVALGRALVRSPAVFLFDEPLSNLDATLRVQMRAEIKRLQARLGTTAVYVTHDQVEAMTMGSRIAVLDRGRLQQAGPPLELYERPANLFVARFIGSPPMNLLPGELQGGATRFAGPGVALPVPPALRAAAAARDGARVVAGIRPEHVLPPGRPARGESATIPVTVELAEPLGDQVVVHARAGEAPLVFRQGPHAIPAEGERLEVAIELAGLHLFDAITERRLA